MTRRRVGTAIAAVIAVTIAVLALVTTGGGPEKTLRETSDNLAQVRSGQLSMRFVIAGQSDARHRNVGFAIKGRFALATKARGLPRADLAYTQIAGPQRRTARIVSDGRAAWIRVGEQAYTLPAERTRRLRRSANGTDGAAGLDTLRIDRWIDDPDSGDGGTIDGVATTRITGKLRVATALRDLAALSRRAGTGAGGPKIHAQSGSKLEAAKENASITLHTGEDDRVLRKLVLRASFPLARTRDLGGTIGRLRGAEITFSLSLRQPGRPVRIARPANPQPLSALGS